MSEENTVITSTLAPTRLDDRRIIPRRVLSIDGIHVDVIVADIVEPAPADLKVPVRGDVQEPDSVLVPTVRVQIDAERSNLQPVKCVVCPRSSAYIDTL